MRRIFKWAGIVLAVLVVVVVSLPFLINVNQFKPMLESELSTALNREVKLGNLIKACAHLRRSDCRPGAIAETLSRLAEADINVTSVRAPAQAGTEHCSG